MRNCLKSKTKKTMWVFFFYKYGIFLGIFISNKLSFSELWLICNSPNILAKLEAWRLNFAIKSCFCKGSLLNQKYLLFLIPILQWGTHCNLIMFQDLKYRSYCIWLHLFFKIYIVWGPHLWGHFEALFKELRKLWLTVWPPLRSEREAHIWGWYVDFLSFSDKNLYKCCQWYWGVLLLWPLSRSFTSLRLTEIHIAIHAT